MVLPVRFLVVSIYGKFGPSMTQFCQRLVRACAKTVSDNNGYTCESNINDYKTSADYMANNANYGLRYTVKSAPRTNDG
jgi:hypothetical protein